MKKNQAANTRRLREKRKAEGVKQVTLYVPVDRVDEIKDIASAMRAGAKVGEGK